MSDINARDVVVKIEKQTKSTLIQNIFRWLLVIFMVYAGLSHLTFSRDDFQAQVPDWLPLSKDLVVVISGIIEMALGLGLAFWKSKRTQFGWILALFFVLVFPGNVAQYVDGKDAFGVLDSDSARGIRLFFQPILILWTLWSAGSWKAWRTRELKD